jgi:selenocysteine lyase/cysteine desulfurase
LLPLLERLVTDLPSAGPVEHDEQALRSVLFPVTKQYIYMNHASIAALPQTANWAMQRFLNDHCFHGTGLFEEWMTIDQRVRERFARLINAQPEQVCFTRNTSAGLVTVATGLAWKPGDNIITASGEFPSNVYPWLNLQSRGVEVRFVPCKEGRILLEDIEARIDERTRLISLSSVEFATGFRNNLAAVGKVCREHGILFGVDGIQSLGALQLDVQACQIDFLAASSPKWLMGPIAVGILWISPELLPQLEIAERSWRSFIDPFDFYNYQQPLKESAERFEGGTNNFTGLVGLDASLAMFETVGISAIEARILGLTWRLAQGLQALGYPLISPLGEGERSGILCFRARPGGLPVEQMCERFKEARIIVIQRDDGVRVSPHFYNTEAEVDRLLTVLEGIG